MANPTKDRIREVVYEVLGRLIVEYDTVNPDIISKSEVDELVNKFYELTNG